MGAINRAVGAAWDAGLALAELGLRATKGASAPPRDPVVAAWFGGGDTAAAH